MATATFKTASVPTPIEPAPADRWVAWTGIGWTGYLGPLEVRGEKSRPQIIHLDGDAYLVTTSNGHERMADRSGTFVRVVVEELDTSCEPTRETTFHGQDHDAGVQPDDSFCLANDGTIAAKDDLSLDVDPPPDLVIEVEHTNPAKHAVEALRRLGVPEVWACGKGVLRFLALKKNGRCVESKRSPSFPFLKPDEVFDRVARPWMTSMAHRIKELRRWVRDEVVPRVRGQVG